MRPLLAFFLIVCGWAACPPALALEYEKDDLKASLSGYLDGRAIYALDRDVQKEYPTTELGLEAKMERSTWIAAKSSLRLVDDGLVTAPQNGLFFNEFNKIYQDKNPYASVDEAYVDFYSGKVDVRVGIQKFAWGRMDEINPTDNLNTEDLTRGTMNEEAERKIGIPAIRANTYSDTANIELVWIPRYVPYRLPKPTEKWFPGVLKAPPTIDAIEEVGSIPVTSTHEEIDMPAGTFRNSEAGVRISKYVEGWDLSISYFNGYDPMPQTEAISELAVEFIDPFALSYDVSLDMTFQPVYDRMHVFGFDFTTTVSSFTVRGEYAYYRNKHYNRRSGKLLSDMLTPARQQQITQEFLQNYIDSSGAATRQTFVIDPEVNIQIDCMKYGVGLDYIYGDTSISGQFIQEYAPDYDDAKPVYFLNKNGFNSMLTLLFKQFFLQNTLEINLGCGYGIESQEYAVRPSVKYSFTNSLKGTLGMVWLAGRYDDSMFGQFEDNDEIYASLRCSF